MKYPRVIRHFGGITKTAQALGLQRQTVHVWGARKRIPSRWQLKLEILSDGALKADAAARQEAIELTSYVRACST